jgi:hypothetical protein
VELSILNGAFGKEVLVTRSGCLRHRGGAPVALSERVFLPISFLALRRIDILSIYRVCFIEH